MGWLDRLRMPARESALWLYVRCGRCGTKVRVRISLANDLSLADEGGYLLRKEIVDDRCHQLMLAELHFDEARRVVSRELSGGEFISEEEWVESSE